MLVESTSRSSTTTMNGFPETQAGKVSPRSMDAAPDERGVRLRLDGCDP